MKILAIDAAFSSQPLPADWQAQLTSMLGNKPRRISVWAEMGLFGALRCMTGMGNKAGLLTQGLLVLVSRQGTDVATRTALSQMSDGVPMPLTFLQTQPSQLLALLVATLKWQGNALFLAGVETPQALWLAASQVGDGGAVLFGEVEEVGGTSNWLLMHPDAVKAGGFSRLEPSQIYAPGLSHLGVSSSGLTGRRGYRADSIEGCAQEAL